MSTHYSRIFDLWRELKRRKVTRVITVYAAAAFVILELVSIIVEPLRLPDWTLTLVIVLLFVGLVIAFVLSWIYDVTPEGIEKTKPAHATESPATPGSSKGWKIASYISFVVIVGLILWNVFASGKTDGIKGELVKSIAVLPFNNFSTDPDQESMCLGLTNEIINHLYKVASFDRISSFTTVLTYREPGKKSREIAEELGVNYILQGSYTKADDQLRITTQLIEAGSERYVWQEEYDRPYDDIIQIQSDIALSIADKLDAFLTSSEKAEINKIPTANRQAYELVQEAIVQYNSFDFISTDQLLPKTQKAIELDPKYADAWAWTGIFNLYSGVYVGTSSFETAVSQATPYFNHALELDKNCSYAHLGLGNIYEWYHWDYIKAEEHYRMFTDINPNYTFTLAVALLPEFYLKMNRIENAETFQVDFVLDILNVSTRLKVLEGKKVEALSMLNMISRDLDDWRWFLELGYSYTWMSSFDSVRHILEIAINPENPNSNVPRFIAALAAAYQKTSSPDRAEILINQLKSQSESTTAGSPAFYTGWYYSWNGETDSAFHWLEKAYENRSPEFPWLKVDPAFNSLKGDDRYWDLYERTGHKAYDEYMASLEH